MGLISDYLKPVETGSIDVSNTILIYVSAGVIFVLFSIVLIILIFSLATKKSLDKYSSIVVLVILLISLPTAILFVGKKTYLQSRAEYQFDVNRIEVVSMNDDFFVVTYNTPSPEISYIQVITKDGSTIPILPTYSLEKRTDHSVLVPKIMREQDTYIVVRGEIYQIQL